MSLSHKHHHPLVILGDGGKKMESGGGTACVWPMALTLHSLFLPHRMLEIADMKEGRKRGMA